MALAVLPVPAGHRGVGVEQLASVALRLIGAGCRFLLLEKPGALCLSQLEAMYRC